MPCALAMHVYGHVCPSQPHTGPPPSAGEQKNVSCCPGRSTHVPVAVRSHVLFMQNWNVGSQSALDVHEPNVETSLCGLLPESLGAAPVEQLATVVRPPEHVDDFGGKFLALHVVTGEPPPPQV